MKGNYFHMLGDIVTWNYTNYESDSKYGRKKNLRENEIPTHLQLDMSESVPQNFDNEEEMLLDSLLRTNPVYYQSSIYQDLRKTRIKRSSVKQIKPKIRKTNPTNSYHQTILSQCNGVANTTFENSSISCNHLASSAYGLIVVLNPNEEEYGTALKNNFVGFKTLVHSPYDFPEVDGIGMAMNKNIRSFIGTLHIFTLKC